MTLPVTPPVSPMLAKLVRELPTNDGLFYEPKWDGFRCVVFRDGDDIELASRNERPFTRYFPELIEPLKAALPERVVVLREFVPDNQWRRRQRDCSSMRRIARRRVIAEFGRVANRICRRRGEVAIARWHGANSRREAGVA